MVSRHTDAHHSRLSNSLTFALQSFSEIAPLVSACRMKTLRSTRIRQDSELPEGDCGKRNCRFSLLNPANWVGGLYDSDDSDDNEEAPRQR